MRSTGIKSFHNGESLTLLLIDLMKLLGIHIFRVISASAKLHRGKRDDLMPFPSCSVLPVRRDAWFAFKLIKFKNWGAHWEPQ